MLSQVSHVEYTCTVCRNRNAFVWDCVKRKQSSLAWKPHPACLCQAFDRIWECGWFWRVQKHVCLLGGPQLCSSSSSGMCCVVYLHCPLLFKEGYLWLMCLKRKTRWGWEWHLLPIPKTTVLWWVGNTVLQQDMSLMLQPNNCIASYNCIAIAIAIAAYWHSNVKRLL